MDRSNCFDGFVVLSCGQRGEFGYLWLQEIKLGIIKHLSMLSVLADFTLAEHTFSNRSTLGSVNSRFLSTLDCHPKDTSPCHSSYSGIHWRRGKCVCVCARVSNFCRLLGQVKNRSMVTQISAPSSLLSLSLSH